MKRSRNKLHWTAFWFLIAFSSFLIIVLGSVFYLQGKNSAIRQQKYFIEQAQNTVDEKIYSFKQEMNALVNSYQINNFSYEKSTRSLNYYQIYQQIAHFKEMNIPDNLYVAYKANNLIVSNKSSFPISSFFKTKLEGYKIDQQDFLNFLFSDSSDHSWYQNISGKINKNGIILLKQPLKYQNSNATITAFCLIDTNMLLSDIEKFFGNTRAEIHVLDQNLKVFASTEYGTQTEFAISYTQLSSIGPWTYEILIPCVDLYQSIWLSIGVVLVLVALGLAIYLCSAGYVFHRNQKYMIQIVNDGQHALQQLQRQMPYVRQDFLKKLVYREFQKADQIFLNASLADLPLKFAYYQVGIIEMQQEVSPADLLEMQQMKPKYPAMLCIEEVHERQMLVLFGWKNTTELEEQVSNFALHINRDKLQPISCIGFGDIQKNVMDISLSYTHAWCALMNYSEYSKENTIFYQEMTSRIRRYYLPASTKNKLVQDICAGKLKEVSNEMNALIFQNIGEQSLNHEGFRLLWLEFYEILLRVQETILIEDEQIKSEISFFHSNFYQLNHILRLQDVKTLFQKIAQYAADFQLQVGDKDDLIYQIQEYLNENFRNPDISLQMLTKQFHISETYLSHLFKKAFHINFSHHLEDLRLQEACTLLQKSQLPIAIIVEQIGYSSVNTFGKAFKRKYQVTASQFRNSQRQDSNIIFRPEKCRAVEKENPAAVLKQQKQDNMYISKAYLKGNDFTGRESLDMTGLL